VSPVSSIGKNELENSHTYIAKVPTQQSWIQPYPLLPLTFYQIPSLRFMSEHVRANFQNHNPPQRNNKYDNNDDNPYKKYFISQYASVCHVKPHGL